MSHRENRTENQLAEIKSILTLINDLEAGFVIERNRDSCGELLYTGVVQSDVIAAITPLVVRYFGPAVKCAGENKPIKNFFDGFARAVGGMRKEQTFFKKEFEGGIILYCAFWPWGSDPGKTSVRLELLCGSKEEVKKQLTEELAGFF